MDTVLKLFLETSVFNFYVDGKLGQKRQDTIKLFDAIADGKYEMGHIDKRKTMIGTGFINLRAGYKNIGISSTMEVIDYAAGRVSALYIILIGTRNGVTHDE
jgi:hypothetical protein